MALNQYLFKVRLIAFQRHLKDAFACAFFVFNISVFCCICIHTLPLLLWSQMKHVKRNILTMMRVALGWPKVKSPVWDCTIYWTETRYCIFKMVDYDIACFAGSRCLIWFATSFFFFSYVDTSSTCQYSLYVYLTHILCSVYVIHHWHQLSSGSLSSVRCNRQCMTTWSATIPNQLIDACINYFISFSIILQKRTSKTACWANINQ